MLCLYNNPDGVDWCSSSAMLFRQAGTPTGYSFKWPASTNFEWRAKNGSRIHACLRPARPRISMTPRSKARSTACGPRLMTVFAILAKPVLILCNRSGSNVTKPLAQFASHGMVSRAVARDRTSSCSEARVKPMDGIRTRGSPGAKGELEGPKSQISDQNVHAYYPIRLCLSSIAFIASFFAVAMRCR